MALAEFILLAKTANNQILIHGLYGNNRSEAYRILRPERWVGRQHHGPLHEHHCRFMRPLCQDFAGVIESECNSSVLGQTSPIR